MNFALCTKKDTSFLVSFLLFLLLVLKVAGNNLLKVFLGDKESSDCEQACDTYNTYDGADGVRVVDDYVSGNRKDKNLENICGSKVYKHAYKLKTDYYTKYALKEVLAVGEMSVYVEVVYKDLCNLGVE